MANRAAGIEQSRATKAIFRGAGFWGHTAAQSNLLRHTHTHLLRLKLLPNHGALVRHQPRLQLHRLHGLERRRRRRMLLLLLLVMLAQGRLAFRGAAAGGLHPQQRAVAAGPRLRGRRRRPRLRHHAGRPLRTLRQAIGSCPH